MVEHDDERSDLSRPVAPPSMVQRVVGEERHLTRRVLAPALLLLISVPVVVLLLVNLRAVSGGPGSGGTVASTPAATRSTAPSSPATPSRTATPTPTPTPTTAFDSVTADGTATIAPLPTPSPSTSPATSRPRVTAVSPTSGPAAGGTVVTLTGTGLDAVTQVLIGAYSAGNLQHVSDTRITVTTPGDVPGETTFAVKAGGDDVASAVSTFTYG